MDIKSEYYLDFSETMEKYEIPEETIPFAGESFQSLEEMLFKFAIFLIT
ncbi:MAG: hypothetical protein ACOWWH_00755 [Eubacteriaceae bacterium]